MVTLTEVIASNKRITSTFPNGLVAVFVGGTSGVGEYTVKKFAKYTSTLISRVYIVGRSQEAADRILADCRLLSPGSKFEFIKADVSLLKEVDQVCKYIKSKESKINILFLTQASMAFKSTTSEALPLSAGLMMHSRPRFVLNLLPLIQSANSLRRVVSVGAATFEGKIDLDNMSSQGFPLLKMRDQNAAIQSLLLQKMAREAPEVGFIHSCPGVVKSGIMREAHTDASPGLRMIIFISGLLSPFIQVPPDECGERNLFMATSARYPPREGGAAVAGVSLSQNLAEARGADGQVGSGMYSVNTKGESAPPKVDKVLQEYWDNGTAEKVWEHIAADFKRITGTEVGA